MPEVLPNDGNYCFLNSALQQLYGIKNFREKVLGALIDDTPAAARDHRELIAARNIFEHLKGLQNLSDTRIKEYMRMLGYTGRQEDSGEHMKRIMEACKRSFKILKRKEIRNIEINNLISLNMDRNDTIFNLISGFCRAKIDIGEFPNLILKGKQFIVNITRTSKNLKLSLEDTLLLHEISPILAIKTSKNSNPIEDPTFDLVGVTIHRGTSGSSGHYYVYVRSGNRWVCKNDNKISAKNWRDIKNDIIENGTVLVYKKA